MSTFHHQLFLALCLLLTSLLANAEVFLWTDEKGRSHFTDKPPEKKEAKPVEIGPINTYTAPPKIFVDETLARPVTHPNKRATLVMYSASWCEVCAKAKDWLKTNKISFSEYDIETSKRGKSDFERFGGRRVPFFVIGRKRMVGFSPSRMKELLKNAGYKIQLAKPEQN